MVRHLMQGFDDHAACFQAKSVRKCHQPAGIGSRDETTEDTEAHRGDAGLRGVLPARALRKDRVFPALWAVIAAVQTVCSSTKRLRSCLACPSFLSAPLWLPFRRDSSTLP